jgi:hypothetical protein
VTRGHGLEWLLRLLSEPRRLWYRHWAPHSQFPFFLALELLGIKKFDGGTSLEGENLPGRRLPITYMSDG